MCAGLEYVPQSARAIAINPITNKVYVVYISSNDVAVLNGSTGAFIKRLTVRNSPREVQLNTVSNMIYVANEGSPRQQKLRYRLSMERQTLQPEVRRLESFHAPS